MFAELCGDKCARNVMFVTTMWDKAKDMAAAEKKEAALKERYWHSMIYHGASVGRFHISGPDSPWELVDKMTQRNQLGQALRLQEEMVDEKKRFNETNARKALSYDLQKLLLKQSKLGGETDADVKEDMADLSGETENTEESEVMKTPLGRRIALSFTRAFGRNEQVNTNYHYCIRIVQLNVLTSRLQWLLHREYVTQLTSSPPACILSSAHYTDL